MNDKELYRELLLKLKEEIAEQIEENNETLTANVKDATGDHSSYSFHLADMGSDTMDRETAFWRASVGKSLFREIIQALEKLETGEYGICESCGQQIHEKRLEAIPHAKLCLDCKSREETGNY
ncbi:TraR/DksA family transcriptional regulator [candidate division KSB1 bacterium]|nr:TraR/DksA family transcriptional regulator [candidate division KSB1 bacterium]